MRRIHRLSLPARAQRYLDQRQASADEQYTSGTLDIENRWSDARKTKAVGGQQDSVLSTLQQMSGSHQRCMYCLDSHGCDIEHFRPKTPYPQHAFRWSNLLLCCTECGRFKGSQFPIIDSKPLLVDPTQEDPWQHLDFDPETGNLTVRYDLASQDYSLKGHHTVDVLKFDRREALSRIYLRTFRRLSRIVRDAIQESTSIALQELQQQLLDVDDHGLLPWCFGDIGSTVAPFSDLREMRPEVWAACEAAFR